MNLLSSCASCIWVCWLGRIFWFWVPFLRTCNQQHNICKIARMTFFYQRHFSKEKKILVNQWSSRFKIYKISNIAFKWEYQKFQNGTRLCSFAYYQGFSASLAITIHFLWKRLHVYNRPYTTIPTTLQTHLSVRN